MRVHSGDRASQCIELGVVFRISLRPELADPNVPDEQAGQGGIAEP
jgi:hypothetical protein